VHTKALLISVIYLTENMMIVMMDETIFN